MNDESIKSASELAAERAARFAESEQADSPVEGLDASATEANQEPNSDASPDTDLKQKVASLQEELEASKDKHLRLVAEFDNFRRRSARESLDHADLAQAKAFSALFPVIDNFERAFAQPALDANAEDWQPADSAAFAKGMRLIRDQLRKALTDAGLEEIPTEGAAFDPNLHDALTQMPHDTIAAEHITAVHAKGWKKGDKILRHAQVIVSSGPAT